MAQKLEYEIKGKSDVDQVTGRAKKSVDSLGESFKKAGNDITKKLAGMVSAAALFDKALTFAIDTVREFGMVADQVEKSGLNAEQFQSLAFAAQQSGVSMQTLAKATRQLRTDMAEAAAGNAEQMRKFEALGITMEQLKSGNAQAVFVALANAMSGAATESEKLTIATGFFGDKVGNEILPMLGDVLKLQKDIANAPIVDAATLKMLDEYNDKIDKMIAKFKVAVAQYFRFVDIIEKYTPQGIIIKFAREQYLGNTEPQQTAVQTPKQQSETAKKVIESLKKPEKPEKEPKKEKEKSADTKEASAPTSVSGNVIGVGQNPVISAIHEQIEIAKQQLDYLAIIASRNTSTMPTIDFTNKGATPVTPATANK